MKLVSHLNLISPERTPWPDWEGTFLLPRLGAPVIFLRQ